jgi:hypothetical protein
MVQAERKPRLENQRRLRDLARDHGAEVSLFCAHSAADLRRTAIA